jgi:hypothetical protein
MDDDEAIERGELIACASCWKIQEAGRVGSIDLKAVGLQHSVGPAPRSTQRVRAQSGILSCSGSTRRSLSLDMAAGRRRSTTFAFALVDERNG